MSRSRANKHVTATGYELDGRCSIPDTDKIFLYSAGFLYHGYCELYGGLGLRSLEADKNRYRPVTNSGILVHYLLVLIHYDEMVFI
jgi:hypothetical protein